jgi:hypothetical protein
MLKRQSRIQTEPRRFRSEETRLQASLAEVTDFLTLAVSPGLTPAASSLTLGAPERH